MKKYLLIILISFLSINNFAKAKIYVNDYYDIFKKYNLSDEYNFQNITSICLEQYKTNNTKIYKNDKGEEIIELENEKGFLNCTYNEILEIIKPIPLVNSLKQKQLEKFILENEITIFRGPDEEKATFVFDNDQYVKFVDNKETGRDGWRWGKVGKPLRVFINGKKTTWKVSVDRMALTIKIGKEKAIPFFISYENKKVAQAKRDELIAKKKAREEKAKKEKIAKEKLAKLNERKQNKLDKLDKIVQGNKENYNKLLDIISIKTEMQKNTDELNSILNQYDKTISDIRIEITNFNNFDDVENYQISSNFIDPLNKVLKLSDNNLDKLNSEYEAFKIEKERKRIEEEKRLAEEKIEKEKRLAEEKRKKIEEEKRLAEEKRQALEQKCGQYKVDNSKLDFMGVTAGISWDCFKYILEKNDFDCGHGIIEDLFGGKLSGCKKIGKEGSYISFMENKKSIYFTCGSFKGCDRTLTELAQLIVDKYANKFGTFEMLPHYDSTTQSNVYRGSNPKNDQLIEVGKGIFGGTYVLFNQRETLNF